MPDQSMEHLSAMGERVLADLGRYLASDIGRARILGSAKVALNTIASEQHERAAIVTLEAVAEVIAERAAAYREIEDRYRQRRHTAERNSATADPCGHRVVSSAGECRECGAWLTVDR